MRIPVSRLLSIGFFTAIATASPADAQAFGVYSHSACSAGRGGTGVAAPCSDGSAIYYNPAGLAGLPSVISGGANVILVDATFTPEAAAATENENPPALVPHLFLVRPLSDRFAVGIGVFTPYGLSSRWPDEFRGSFSGSNGKLASFYIQPTAAVQATDWLKLGIGVNAVRASVRLRQRLDLSAATAFSTPAGPVTFLDLGVPHPTGYADATLRGTAWSTGWHAGVLVQVTDWLSFGSRYLSEVKNNFKDGSATFDQIPTEITLPAGNPFGAPEGTPLDMLLSSQFGPGNPLGGQSVSTEITFPSQFVLGASAAIGDRVRLFADHVWTDWSVYREIPIVFEVAEPQVLIQDFKDTGTLRIGAEMDASSTAVLRLGYTRNGPAAPDVTVTPLLPDSDRSSFNLGAGLPFVARGRLDGFISYIAQAERRGRLLPRESRSISAEELNEGEFSGRAFEGGVTVSLPPEAFLQVLRPLLHVR